jgi:thymidylate kinase
MEIIALILGKMGFKIAHTSSKSDSLTLFYLNNPDGSVRWFWASHVSKPLFLRFYNASTWRAWCFLGAMKLVFALRLQRFIFKKIHLYVEETDQKLFSLHTDWAVFTGTMGIQRKALAYSETQNCFYKIALTSQSEWHLLNEHCALRFWEIKKPQSFEVPKLLGKKEKILQTEAVGRQAKRINRFMPVHLRTLQEIQTQTLRTMQASEIPVYQHTKSDLRLLNCSKDERLPKGIVRKLTVLMSYIRPDTLIETCLSHSDFTPWNMYTDKQKIYIYDWELTNPCMPIGYDAFHFIVQQGILVERKSWKEIYKEINEKLGTKYDIKRYLRYYILFNTVYYLQQYEQQKVWHEQIYWLLEVWNDALSMLLKQEMKHRALLAMDIFDFLRREKYALLKSKYESPEDIDDYTDIDLCIDKKTAQKLLAYLRKHNLVKKVRILHKSFMYNVMLFLEDGDVLSVDCIWQFKRKAQYMLSAEEMLENATTNRYGIKQPLPLHEARYIGLFYSLNHAPIPAHYKSCLHSMQKSDSLLDIHLFQYAQEMPQALPAIQRIVRKNAENQGFSKLKNIFYYFVDTLKELLHTRGLMITFSGVDGAGKSTVIEKMVHILNKKLRKKVVVLRHRSSILPILSAWTKGKIQAEKEATEKMPRQGTNQNIMSSLLRFGYYYTDYFLGQFYVYGKYILRGYTVVYDRYYFDFIHDSKRSNITLPPCFTKFWYRFLIKPDINFFLYAQPETILERKQELDLPTIQKLNEDYLMLFESLRKNKHKKRYFSIENIELKKTLSDITQKIMTV